TCGRENRPCWEGRSGHPHPLPERVQLPAPESAGPQRQPSTARTWPSSGKRSGDERARAFHRSAWQRGSREQPGCARASPMSTLEPPEFLRTIYVGDRACRAILIESWKKQVALEVDLISRIRSPSGNWEYYSAEDIPGGRIVFTDVETFQFDPPGPLPNDLINQISVKPADAGADAQRWTFEVSISSVAPDGGSTEIIVRLTGSGVYLEDPKRPGVQIRE